MKGAKFGNYELIRKLAAGGMAEIYLARQRGKAGFFRDVVLKRLFPHLARNQATLDMFQVEARLLAHFNHPNIPQCTELGFADGYWYMTLEYVQGRTIADVWRAAARQGAMMPLPVTLGVALQVCEALDYAHEAMDRGGNPLRIVHRDVTPHNIMVTRSGVVKLMDFGVARTDARVATEAGIVKGTFSYMAPEQIRAKDVDRRADVFSLGVIFYELTTGRRLFRGTDPEVMVSIVEKDAPPPSSWLPDYPADLEEIVMATLRRDPRSRIASAAHLALHLEHFAMRHGLMVGPRAIAAFVQEVIPATPVAEQELALVVPDREGSQRRAVAERQVDRIEIIGLPMQVDDDDVEEFEGESFPPNSGPASSEQEEPIALVAPAKPSSANFSDDTDRGEGLAPPGATNESANDVNSEDTASPPDDEDSSDEETSGERFDLKSLENEGDYLSDLASRLEKEGT